MAWLRNCLFIVLVCALSSPSSAKWYSFTNEADRAEIIGNGVTEDQGPLSIRLRCSKTKPEVIDITLETPFNAGERIKRTHTFELSAKRFGNLIFTERDVFEQDKTATNVLILNATLTPSTSKKLLSSLKEGNLIFLKFFFKNDWGSTDDVAVKFRSFRSVWAYMAMTEKCSFSK